MPIRPENKARYPKDWKDISQRIRKRAKRRCECYGECGIDHRDEMATTHGPEYANYERNWPDRCSARNHEAHPLTGSKVILTVAHLDHTPENCDDDNLKAMCQRCHNRYDAPVRRAGMRQRKRARNAIGELFT